MPKLTLQDAQEFAIRKGGRCLSEKYVRCTAKLEWECVKKHNWSATFNAVLSGRWCPDCVKKSELSLAGAKQFAAEMHGGDCISEDYVNTITKLRWKCKKNHEWTASFAQIRSGCWCPYCAGRIKRTLEDLQECARRRNGICLAERYTNNNTKVLWQCAKEHQWEATSSSIMNHGSWCPQCSGSAKLTIEEMQNIAREKGGKCLSTEYKNNTTKLLWECAEGHRWESAVVCVKYENTWCSICSGKKQGTLEEVQAFAIARGGKCLSGAYNNCYEKLKWQCEAGHVWETRWNSVKSGSWCPNCLFKNESECRSILEDYTNRKFIKTRSQLWLKGLELDGYCHVLRCAFEYQGQQHYKFMPHWHKNGEGDLKEQQERDALKLDLCQRNGVMLIVIPYDTKNKQEFIRKELLHIICLRRHAMTKMSDEIAEELYPRRTMTDKESEELYGHL